MVSFLFGSSQRFCHTDRILNKISMLLSDDVLKAPSSQATEALEAAINAVGLV